MDKGDYSRPHSLFSFRYNPGLNQRQFKRFIEKYADFVVERGRLIYQPLHLEVIPSDDPAKIRTILEEIYRSPETIGKGQNNFYNYVLT
jgi:hypothetical protein